MLPVTSSSTLKDDNAVGAAPNLTAKTTNPHVTMIGKPAKSSEQECINLVQTPVQIGPTDIELELYKCYDAGKPGFLRRASFSLLMAGLTTLMTTALSFVSFMYKKAAGASVCDFFTLPMSIQIVLLVLYIAVGGVVEQVNAKHKEKYIDEVMKRYRGNK